MRSRQKRLSVRRNKLATFSYLNCSPKTRIPFPHEYGFSVHDLWVRRNDRGKLHKDYIWTWPLRMATVKAHRVDEVTSQHKACHATPSDADLRAQQANVKLEWKLPRGGDTKLTSSQMTLIAGTIFESRQVKNPRVAQSAIVVIIPHNDEASRATETDLTAMKFNFDNLRSAYGKHGITLRPKDAIYRDINREVSSLCMEHWLKDKNIFLSKIGRMLRRTQCGNKVYWIYPSGTSVPS